MPSPQVLANRDPAGPEFPGRRGAERLLGLAVAAILGCGLWQGVAAIRSPPAQLRLAATLSWEAFLAGRTAAAVNHVMAQNLPLDGFLRAAGGVFRAKLFGSGGPAVRIGCADWLFLTEELRPWGTGGDAAMVRRADLLDGIATRLAAEGVALRVAVVPEKARAVASLRCGVPYAGQAAARLPAFRALLAARPGIAAVDLEPVLAREGAALFYRTDTHWNQEGARRAAAAIATTAPDGLARETTFRTTVAAEATPVVGDLLRLMSLDRVADRLRPQPDRERAETTAAPEAAEASILDEVAVPEVVLLGSSFSLNGNFHGALQQALSAPVGNFGKLGGGFAGAAAEFFGSPAWRETPPRLVIWEIPERVLNQPLNADDEKLAAWLAQPGG